MKRIYFTILICSSFFGCGLSTAKEINLNFSTERSKIPDTLIWREIGFAKELINQKKKIVVISGGSNPIPLSNWNDFNVSFPWAKNIDRNLLFYKSSFLRSPSLNANCKGDNCITQIKYKGYTWVEIAKPVAVDFIPKDSSTNMLKPDIGILVVKTIQKCQAIMFKDSIYELTDNKGNYYVMHATEDKKPNLNVSLPKGWTLIVKKLKDSLVITPFGGGNDCYYNIIGDHLGQGYH